MIPRHDFLGAIYRIAPDGRPEVASREIPDDPAKAHAFKALAFACGRDDLDLSECSDSWLAAAASVRSPDDPEAIAKGLGRVLPIRNPPVTPAEIATVGRPSQEECDAMLARFGEEFAASGRLNEKLATELQKLKQAAAAPPVPFVVEQVDVPDSADITACMTHLYGHREWLMGRFEMPIPRQDFAAAISLTPHRRDFAIGAAANDLIGEFREANEKPPTEYLPLLDALAHPDQAWDQTANAFLWSCLLQKDGDLKASALDTLIEAIADGRATAGSMAGQLTWALKADGVKRNRLTAPLKTLAEIGPLHAAFVAGVGDAVIASLGENTKGAHDILEPMANAITEVGWLLSDDAKAVLKSFKGSSKAAKLAKRILAAPIQLADATLIASLDGRLARLDRWTSAS